MPFAASRARKPLLALTGTAVALAGLTFVPSAAQAADPLVINLVGINDFHGRINADTIKWAKTVQNVKARGTAADTLFVGAGDLVGASEFASASAQDQPTIDVLNELGLDASSVGNHEFDKGWADLKDRIIGPEGDTNALWDYLGANVYLKGTQTPALPSYWIKDVEGVKVGVIGGVTEETPTLVSPGGITDLDFGPIVPALNRVADQLTDGNADNGEADVIVAVTHAGAVDGSKTYADNEAVAGSEFKDMADNLSSKVSAVFQGHTHQVYAYDAPMPGDPSTTRPMLQTGNYGTNVGNIRLTVDPDTKKVTSYTKENVARVAAVSSDEIAADPALTQVNTTVNNALAAAATVGNQPVGSVTADITTALPRPTEPVTLPPGTNRDDRTNESTLGDLIGNAMRDGVPADMGDPDIGIVNSGGLRSELLYAGDTSSNPANTDGVITYAEANNVLPFVNNVWLGKITGASLKKVLEEQWQPTGASRPKMPLGLSDNVSVTYDESQPRYSKVTSVRIDGKPLDPAKTYTVSTFNFLSTGGDNFTSFKDATWSDTGLVDRDLWISYLKAHQGLSPDFARQQVGVAGPAQATAGEHLALAFSKLDLTSGGSPANTSVVATGTTKGGTTVDLGSFPVSGGAANIGIDVPASLGNGSITFVAQPSNTTVTFAVAPAKHLVISEFYGNGGNSGANLNADFLELYNPTASPVDLAGLSVQYRSATGTGVANGAQALSGVVQPGDHFLVQVQAAGANGAALPTPDFTTSGGLNAGGTNGLVFLAKGTATINPGTGSVVSNPDVVDLLGFGSSNTFEAKATGVGTATTSFSRVDPAIDSDDNSVDFTVGAPTPQASATAPAGPVVTNPGTKSVEVDKAITPIVLTATGGTPPYTWSATGLPAGLSLNGDTISGTPSATGSSSVTVTATDAAAKTATATFTITVTPKPAEVAISAIQGPGATSPLVDQTVTTTGVVTADYDKGGFNGVYIQDPKGDASDTSSDAIFVFGSNVPADLSIGDSVSVTGKVSEYQGTTELTPVSGGVSELSDSLGTVQALSLPWGSLDTDAEKEAHEGELITPTGAFTVTDNYDANYYGSFTLASGTTELRTPTEYADDKDSAGIDAIKADNAQRMITLDDGASTNFNSAANKGTPLPYLTKTNPVRIGSAVTFHQPVVLEYRFSLWNFQPTVPVTGDGTDVVTFSDTRADNASPRNVGGDVRLATFNVLNYFPTTGKEYVDSGLGTCSFYDDRDGNHITDNTCTGKNGSDLGPRGAATAESLARQQVKIVKAINGLGASIVSLEELENSVWFGKDRDFAINQLVTALNAQAGAGTWAYAPSPEPSELPPLADQDVIRTGFIYKPADVTLVGTSHVLHDKSGTGQAFENAREPLAQGFKRKGAPDSDAFLVIVNHFKSKGSGADDGTGQGNANPDRVAQAHALVDFAQAQETALGTDKVFFTGDFNAYSKEDPVQVIEAAGYTELNGEFNHGEATYSFDGMDGSLDHVFANAAAKKWVTGVDVWQINAQEQVGFEYSRYNYNATILYEDSVFRASDHNPEIVGLDLPEITSPPVKAPVTLKASPVTSSYGKGLRVRIHVVTTGKPTGLVTLFEGGRRLGSASVSNGWADVLLGRGALTPGTHTLRATYAGDATHESATANVTVRVAKAAVAVSATVKPGKVKVRKGRATVVIAITGADGVAVDGVVTVSGNGLKTVRVTVHNGRATVKLPKFKTKGKKVLSVVYRGSGTTNSGRTSVTIRVVK